MNTPSPLEHGHWYTCVPTTSKFSVSSVPGSHPTPIVAQPKKQTALREMPKPSQKSGNRFIAVSPRSSLLPDGKRGASQGRYLCSICGLDFAQKQGVTRHHRDVHEASSCTLCPDFKWHRPHQLKKHLEEKHPDVDLPASLGEVTRSRRKATKIENRLRQQAVKMPVLYPRRVDRCSRWQIGAPVQFASESSEISNIMSFYNIVLYL